MSFKEIAEAREFLDLKLKNIKGTTVKETMGGKARKVTPKRDFAAAQEIACTVLKNTEKNVGASMCLRKSVAYVIWKSQTQCK